jgi:LmbE family N-acetylglucosaminyl deacetylase
MLNGPAMADERLDIAQVSGPVLIVAPHPDDESIGCGGLIALLRQRGVEVKVVIVTDGTGSHPHSTSHPPERLAALRRDEAVEALSVLGVGARSIAFWQLGDRFVPTEGDPGFETAVARAQVQLHTLCPRTLVIPGNADLHGDHRAVSHIWKRAVATTQNPPRILEYLVWSNDGHSRPGRRVSLDIDGVLALKSRAIGAHRSQHGKLIEDDPTAFCLPDELLDRASEPREIFFETGP